MTANIGKFSFALNNDWWLLFKNFKMTHAEHLKSAAPFTIMEAAQDYKVAHLPKPKATSAATVGIKSDDLDFVILCQRVDPHKHHQRIYGASRLIFGEG